VGASLRLGGEHGVATVLDPFRDVQYKSGKDQSVPGVGCLGDSFRGASASRCGVVHTYTKKIFDSLIQALFLLYRASTMLTYFARIWQCHGRFF
jgi:hypothetical protein